MAEVLGIAAELAERRRRIAAKQSGPVAARLMVGSYARQADEVLRLSAENDRLRRQLARLERSLDVARETLTSVAQPRAASDSHGDTMRLVRAMAAAFGTTERDILARRRLAHIVNARAGVMLAMRRVYGWTYRHIAVQMGRDESSARGLVRKAVVLHAKSEPWANRYHDAVNQILPHLAEAA